MRRISRITVSLGFSLAFIIAPPRSQGREWTDSTGQFHRLGDFVSCDGVEVLLRNERGGSTRIRWENLSRDDQLYVFGLARPATQSPAQSVPATATVAVAKPVTRFANYQSNATTSNVTTPSTATPNADDDRNYDSAGGNRLLRKYIYCGCEGRFDLEAIRKVILS